MPAACDRSCRIVRPAQPVPLRVSCVEAELSQSFKIYDEAAENVKELFLNASRDEALSTETICVLASEITKSVVRNEYAMAILTRLRHHSTYQWEHSINCGVLMCGFALFLGLKEDVVTQLTLGAMLHDVGVAKVSRGILDKKTQFTANDISVMKKHISWGVEICKRDGFSTKIITEMTVNHHERLDGSGYPRGLKAEKISKLSRMIAIIDVYDAITGEKTYKDTMQPIDALRHLLGKKEHFDQELVQQFIKYVGVYPVGSLVKLSNDRLAIVMQGNRVNPVKPIVKVFFNITEMSYISAKTHNLQDYSVNIVAAVNAEEFDINLSHVIRKTIA